MYDFTASASILKIFLLFLEGVLSFLSPCVIPILPIYIGILAGKKEKNIQGELVFNKRNIIVNTLFFVLGISATFFILAFATSRISIFLNDNIKILQIISGILIIFMGLLQLGIFKISALNREFSMKNKLTLKKGNTTPILAFLMGFTFSFSWTPCIGPILAGVFIYASSHTGIMSIILVLVYSLGFILPFILVAFFATQLLTVFKKNDNILKYTSIISGAILIIIGILILSGSFATIMRYFN
ncbi:MULTISPECIES: cytochrome c biogenesis CcdA family protein [Gemella]|uniref:cytochrome c biogenesis CcdA family protein n=1 Tax=Gemella TaxID=1378 RepID=UPI000767F69E|nr:MULTISPECIES: cytochrome c biogenesis protein CcdA [Gemella]AME08783.1 cytochrome C biogenesis protein [Gemella sp. oral taxon 928]AXI26354.1 cytochrome C biogenesis protein [Gemella sp. ND 6198]